jgi:hypothetical protein
MHLQDFSAWVEGTALSKDLFRLPWLWPICESLHFLGLTTLIGGAGLLDLRLMGMFRGVPLSAIRAFMPWAIGGFAVNATTGVLFLTMQPHLYLSSGIFWAKMGFVGLAGVNALFFETRLSSWALAMNPDDEMPLTLKAIGAVSLFAWFAVLYCGRMLPYLGSGN